MNPVTFGEIHETVIVNFSCRVVETSRINLVNFTKIKSCKILLMTTSRNTSLVSKRAKLLILEIHFCSDMFVVR